MTRWLIAMVALGGLACGDDDGSPMDAGDDTAVEEDGGVDTGVDAGPGLEPLDFPPLDAANAVTPADGEELYQGMLRFLWDNWGVEVLDEWPPAEFMLQLMEDEPDVFGNQYESFGFVPDPNDDFPVGFKRGLDDPTKVYQTCAICHVGELPDGRLWIGAPSNTLRFGDFRSAVSERWVAAGNDPLVTPLQQSKALELGPGRFNAESGDYEQVVPADFPPYWNFAERDHFNYLGTGREARTEIYFSIFTFGAGAPNEDEAIVPFPERERTSLVIQWFEHMTSPEGPAEDATMVEMGRTIFERERCAECHHIDSPVDDGIIPYSPDGIERFPGDDAEHPDGTIATSRLHRVLIDGDGGPSDEGRADLIAFIVRNRLAVGMSDGYRTSQLGGVWATAPYLHNGSVPTLEDLLRPASERPTTFDREGFIVDTTVAGNSNEGHEFGTEITEDERSALAAYLRTL